MYLQVMVIVLMSCTSSPTMTPNNYPTTTYPTTPQPNSIPPKYPTNRATTSSPTKYPTQQPTISPNDDSAMAPTTFPPITQETANDAKIEPTIYTTSEPTFNPISGSHYCWYNY